MKVKPDQNDLERRRVLKWGLAAVAGTATLGVGSVLSRLRAATQTGAPTAGTNVTIENFSPDGKSLGLAQVAKIVKSNAEWRAQLSALSFEVAREEGTEPPFSGEYAESRGDGLYRCICCDTALYDSRTKFDSGTGWPSFWQPISPHNIVKSADYSLGMQRDAISCRRCDAHLGHVFDDGPRPTGLRYCMNSVALRFVARA
jgi:peptide-methionine (R)-S-oxide reductase